MSGKKKTKAKPVAKKKVKPASAVLRVEVLQYGCPQAVGQWASKRFFSKDITFGVDSGADLSLPFTKLPAKIRVFQIRDNKVFAVLDPRAEGFINRGHEFGDVREFLSPRGALAEVATIDDPLLLELKPGSRGTLRVYGFEVIFKYDFPVFKKQQQGFEHAGRGFFSRREVDTPAEGRALWVALGAVVCALFPFLVWLGYGKSQEYKTLVGLPQEFLLRIVSHEHLPLLPRILEDEIKADDPLVGATFGAAIDEDESQKDPLRSFRSDVAVSQAAYVVSELQKRWRFAEDGVHRPSHISLLRFPSPVSLPLNIADNWKVSADAWYGKVKFLRANPSSNRYYLYQAETPRLAVMTTGEKRGSLRVRTERRISQLRRLYQSAASLVQTEQEFVRSFYEKTLSFKPRFDTKRATGAGEQIDKGVDLGPYFLMPEDAIVSAKPEQHFLWEIQRYQAAQSLAEHASELTDRWKPPREKRSGEEAQSPSTIWLERDGALVPTFSGVRIETLSGAEEAIVQNAKYSLAEKELPPQPPPPARVDEQGVRFVIISKKEQIKACYERLLSRNPAAAGTLRMGWTIDMNGRARNPKVVSGSVTDRELQQCLSARLMQWQFPKPQNGVVGFEYPFQFATKQR